MRAVVRKVAPRKQLFCFDDLGPAGQSNCDRSGRRHNVDRRSGVGPLGEHKTCSSRCPRKRIPFFRHALPHLRRALPVLCGKLDRHWGGLGQIQVATEKCGTGSTKLGRASNEVSRPKPRRCSGAAPMWRPGGARAAPEPRESNARTAPETFVRAAPEQHTSGEQCQGGARAAPKRAAHGERAAVRSLMCARQSRPVERGEKACDPRGSPPSLTPKHHLSST